jgi:DNA invertase Pin-like site-specific DNA recombinase
VLVVWKLDRLGRSLSHLIRILSDLKARGVGFHSITEAIDTTTPQGVLMFNIRIIDALEAGASKASVCRTFEVSRSTLKYTLERIGWTARSREVA